MFIKGHLHSLLNFYHQSNLLPVPFLLRKMHENKKKYRWRKFCINLSNTSQNSCFFFPTRTIMSELVTFLALWDTGSQALLWLYLSTEAKNQHCNRWLMRIPICPSYMMIYVLFRDVCILILIFYRVLSLLFPLQSPMTMKTVLTKKVCDSTIFNIWSTI